MRNKEPQLVSLSVAIYLFLSHQVAAVFVLICLCLYSVPGFKATGWLLSYARVLWRLLLNCRTSLTSCLEGQWRTDVHIKHWKVKGENEQFLNACTHIFCIVTGMCALILHPHCVLKIWYSGYMVYKGMTGWKISLDTVSETKTVVTVVLQDFLNVLQKVISKQYFIFLKKNK